MRLADVRAVEVGDHGLALVVEAQREQVEVGVHLVAQVVGDPLAQVGEQVAAQGGDFGFAEDEGAGLDHVEERIVGERIFIQANDR